MIDFATLPASAAEARILEWWGLGYRMASDLVSKSTFLFRLACPDCGNEPALVGITETCPCGWRRER